MLSLQREPSNKRDPNAILVVLTSDQHIFSPAADSCGSDTRVDADASGVPPAAVGHLPATLASRLAPIMDSGGVQFVCSVLEVLMRPV